MMSRFSSLDYLVTKASAPVYDITATDATNYIGQKHFASKLSEISSCKNSTTDSTSYSKNLHCTISSNALSIEAVISHMSCQQPKCGSTLLFLL